MSAQKARAFELECGHVLWFKIAPTNQDELLWCKECKTERPLLAATVALKGAWTYHPQLDFRSKRIKRSVFDAQCTFGTCKFTLEKIWGFNIVRNLMHSHYMREHTNRGIEIRYVERIEYTEPPF